MTSPSQPSGWIRIWTLTCKLTNSLCHISLCDLLTEKYPRSRSTCKISHCYLGVRDGPFKKQCLARKQTLHRWHILFTNRAHLGKGRNLFSVNLPLMWNILYLQSPVYVIKNSQGTNKNVILAFGFILFFKSFENTLNGSLQHLNTQCTTNLIHILAMATFTGGMVLLLRHSQAPQTQNIAPGMEQSYLWSGKARCLCGKWHGTLLTQAHPHHTLYTFTLYKSWNS